MKDKDQEHIFSFSGQPGGLSYPGRVAGDPGEDARQVLPGAAHAPADHTRQVDPVSFGVSPHQRPPAVPLTRVLAPHSARTQHGVSHSLAQRLPTLAEADQGEADLLEAGGQHEAALQSHAPTSHSQRVLNN